MQIFVSLQRPHNSSRILSQGFDSRSHIDAGTPWNINTMSRIVSASIYHQDIKIDKEKTFEVGEFRSYRKIPALQPLIMMGKSHVFYHQLIFFNVMSIMEGNAGGLENINLKQFL